MSAWIPALHARMTNREVLLKVTEAPPPRIFKGAHEGHEGSENYYYYISMSSFVLFATFVVIMSVSILIAALPRCVSAVNISLQEIWNNL
jgi:hypothetical protein